MTMDTTMSDQPDPREAQIAALEAALQLPLPESTLAQIAQDLRATRRRGANEQEKSQWVSCDRGFASNPRTFSLDPCQEAL
jgi:hypothetical protein